MRVVPVLTLFRAVSLLALVTLVGCRPPDAALKVTVTLKSQGTTKVRADCIRLAVLDGTDERKSIVVPRPAANDDTLVFAVLRGDDLPKTVNLQVTGLVGTCTNVDALLLNAQSTVETAVFPESGVTPFELSLEPASSALDADRDGFVAASKGGPDCKDDDATVFPGATQVCSNPADTDCDGTGGCDDSECGSAMFCAGPGDRLKLSATTRTMERNTCLGPITVELQNDMGPRLAVRDTPVTFESSITGVTVHTTASCNDAPVTTFPILFNQSQAIVYLKANDTAFGTNHFKATGDRVAMPGLIDIEVHPVPVASLKFSSAPMTVTAGVCSPMPITLEFRDVQNRRTDVDAPTTVNLSSMPGDLMNANIFFSDPGCTTENATPTLQPGQGQVTTFVLARRAGTFTMTGAPSVGTSDTQMLTVMPTTADRLQFTNNPIALTTTNPCSPSPLVVRLEDRFGNPAVLGSDYQVQMSTTGPSPIRFFPASDMTCSSTAATTFTIPAGMSVVSVRASSTTMPGANTVLASGVLATPVIAGASQPLFVSAGVASHYAWLGSAQTPLAGVCSGNPITLELRDSQGNPTSSATNVTFALSIFPSVGDGQFAFFSGAGCVTNLNNMVTIPSGQVSTQIYFRGNKVNASFEVRATVALSGPTAGPISSNAVQANIPAKLTFAAPLSQTAQAGICSPTSYVVNVLDQYDNPTSFPAAQTITVSSNPANVTVGPGGSCTMGSTVPLPPGAQSASFTTQHTVTGSYALTATVGGFSSSNMPVFSVTPGNVTMDISPSTTTSLVAGTCQNVTLTRHDQFNNIAPTSGNNTVMLNFPTSTAWDQYAQPNCMGTQGAAVTMNSTHQSLFSVRPKTAGAHMVGATVAGLTANLSLNVSPGAPTLVFETPATGTSMASATQGAGGCTPVTLARKDLPYANDVPLGSAQSLALTLPAGATAYASNNCTGGSVTSIALQPTDARVTFSVRGTMSGTSSVSAVLAGQTATLALTVTPGASALVFMTPATGSASVVANTCVPVTVELRDSFSNPAPLASAGTLSLTPTGSITAYASNDCTGGSTTMLSMAASTYTRSFSVRSNTAGNSSFLLSINGSMLTLSLSVSPGALSTFVIGGLPATLVAGTCSTPLTVTRKDAFGNDITADPPINVVLSSPAFSFSSTASTCAGAMATATVNINAGTATSTDMVFATGTLAGLSTVTASYMAVTGAANSTITAATATQLVFTSTPPGSVVSAACTPDLRVELRDPFNNQVRPGSAITVGVSSSATATFSNVTNCGAAGTVQITSSNPNPLFSFRPATATTHTITASVTMPTNLSATQNWTVTPGAANKLGWKQDPTSMPARFACVSAGIIEARDSNDNPTTIGASPVTVTPTASGGNANITFYSDATCTTTMTTTAIPANGGATPEFFMVATGGTMSTNLGATATLVSAPARPVTVGGTQGSLTVSPANPDLEAGACIPLVITRMNAVPAAQTHGVTTVTLASANAGATIHGTTDCSAAAIPNVVIPNGQSAVTVYARGRSVPQTSNPLDITFTASDGTNGSTSGTSTLKAYPLVRRGPCNLIGVNSSRCTLSPTIPSKDISRSFLVFSSNGRPATTSPNAMAPKDQNVECHLDNSGATVDVVCTRAFTNGDMNVQYQVVSFGRDAASGFGVSVQRVVQQQTLTSGSSTTPVTLTTAVDTAKSFILASSTYDADLNDGEGFPLVKFTTTGAAVSSIDILSTSFAPTNRVVSLEVITLGAGTVDHVITTPAMSGTTYSVTTTSRTNSFALAMAQSADGTNSEIICKRRFNTKLTSNTVVQLKRGASSPPAGCTDGNVSTIAVQRVNMFNLTLPTVPDATISNMATSSSVTFTGVTPITKDRSITFMGTQGPGGQAAGETNYAVMGFDGDDTSPAHAIVDFTGSGATATQVTVTRSAPPSNATSVFTPIVVQFNP